MEPRKYSGRLRVQSSKGLYVLATRLEKSRPPFLVGADHCAFWHWGMCLARDYEQLRGVRISLCCSLNAFR